MLCCHLVVCKETTLFSMLNGTGGGGQEELLPDTVWSQINPTRKKLYF